MKKRDEINFLDKIPVISDKINWKKTDDELITIYIENKGFFNKIAQIVFKKPKISQIHLDETGSFIWQRIDGRATVGVIADLLKEKFGEKAEPLYERIVKFFHILNSYGFILWN